MAKSSKNEERNMFLEALTDQYHVIALVFFMLLTLVMWNPAPLLIAAGLELLYMTFVPGSGAFHRYVDRKYRDLEAEDAEKVFEERLAKLHPAQRNRYGMVATLVGNTQNNFEQHPEGLGDHMTRKLEKLRERYLWMMELLNVYEAYLNSLPPGQIERAIADVETQMSESDHSERITRTLQERLEVLHKRLVRLNRVRENHTVVRTQIQTVEDILRLIYEASMTMRDPQGISQQIDDLMIDVESTEETVLELDAVGSASDDAMAAFDRELEEAVSAARY